ncbi:MAG TPA: hypothetical protein VGP94_12235, partial [Tepidisphaeraceae bacterium]|nr:hypothetical protein [Tepidisphaeraceae bacterium]
KDDGSGKAKELLWASNFDGHDSLLPRPGAIGSFPTPMCWADFSICFYFIGPPSCLFHWPN